MMKLNVNGTEYKVKFGYNCFCDTDLMERVQDLVELFKNEKATSDSDVSGVGKIKELFCVVRDLLFFGFKKYNPVENAQEIGDILDDYKDEEKDGEDHGLFTLFMALSDELTNSGFLKDLMGATEDMENGVRKPTDHKSPQKK